MLTDSLVGKLKERYPDLHPLIFHRSLERAKSDGDLFDILDSFPKKFPVVWCETSCRWVVTNDAFQSEEFLGELQ